MTVQELKSKIKSGNLSGWYILSGEEDYLKKHYMKENRDAIISDGAFALFNYISFEF